MDNISLDNEPLITRSISNRSMGSRRNGSQHSRMSNDRIPSNIDEDGEMTPLLASDASSETSEDNPLQNYSTIQHKMINNNRDLPEVPDPPCATPRYMQGGDQYTTGISRSRRNTARSLGSESDCSIIGEERAISFGGALKIPGVLEFSLCLFFAKLVSYTFLYWLPTFIMDTALNVR